MDQPNQPGLEIHHYDNYETPKSKRHPHKLLIAFVVLALLVGGFGAYWYFAHKPKKQTSKTSQPTSQVSEAITSKTKNYNSTQFNLLFDYPADWSVTDTLGSGLLTARSPAVQLKDAEGKSFTGQVLMTIRDKQQPLPEFDKGNAVATRESEKIAYTKPSASQRGSTYISFLHYSSSTEFPTLDGIYVTGDVGYQKDQAIPKADISPIDPVVSISFVKCANSSCATAGTAAGVASSMWDDATLAGPLKSLLQSLVVN